MSPCGRMALFAAVAIAAALAGLVISPSLRPAAADPRALLQASLPDVDGKPQRVAQWRGKVLVVNFWATWCAPCREEIPEFVRLQRSLGSAGLQFVGIAIDTPDPVKAFVAEHGVNYPVLIGELEAMEMARLAGNAKGALPYTLVLDRSGAILSQHYGGLTESSLRPIVERAI